jgi:uncharacterized protein YegJ (DUF2314 family)
MPTVYPDYDRDGFYLENAVMRSRLWPESFSIPEAEVRNSLTPGQLVKMDFTFALESAEKDGSETERMWVIVKESCSDHWIGILDNDPRFHDRIASGYELHFHPDHVVAVWQSDA